MTSLADDVVQKVRDGIRARRYVPGEVYSVYQLAEALGVSRSPVREAMVRLADAGLVEISRNRGFRVLLPSARDLAEIFAVRLALEGPAAARMAAEADSAANRDLLDCMAAMEGAASATAPAATSATIFWQQDRRLHQLILLGAGNRRAARIVEGLRETTALLGEPTARTHAAICAEHRPVVEAIGLGDPAAAEAAMRDHLRSTGLLLMAEASEPGGMPVRELWDVVVRA